MKINWTLIAVLLLAVIVLGVTTGGLWRFYRTERAETSLTTGLAAYEDGQWNEAASCLGRYLSIHPQNIEILMKYAQAQIQRKPFKQGNLAMAMNAYRAVLRNEPNPLAAKELIGIYLKFNMPAEAERIARDYAEKDQTGQILQLLASSLFQQSKFESAVDVLLNVIDRNPDQIMAYKLLSEIAEKHPRISSLSALQWLDKAVENNPASAQVYLLRSAYFARTGNPADATRELEIAEQHDHSDTGTQLRLAAGWIDLGEYSRARAYLAAVRDSEPSSQELWRIWAMLTIKEGNRDEMLWVANTGVASSEPDEYAFLPIAVELFIQAGDVLHAEECIEKLNNMKVDRAIVLYLEGYISKTKADWSGAIQKWQQSINLGYFPEQLCLQLSQIYEELQNRPLAIQVIRRYLSYHEDSFATRLQLSRLYAAEGHWMEAAEQSAAAVRLNPTSLEANRWHLRCGIETTSEQEDFEIAAITKKIQSHIHQDDSVEGHMLMFRLTMKLKDFTSAQERLGQIEQRFGLNEQLVLRQSELLMAQNKLQQAIQAMEKARKTHPESNEIVRALVYSYVKNDQLEDCRTLILGEIDKAKNTLEQRKYQLWLAELSILEKDHEQAAAVYRALAQENKNDLFALRQLLALQLNDTEEKEKQEWIDRIKEIEGDSGWQWKYEQARLWLNDSDFKSKYAQIVEMLQANLVLNPNDQKSRMLLALCYERAGNARLALSLFRDAMYGSLDNVDLIVAAVGTMYRAGEYTQAQQLLDDIAQRGYRDARLIKYKLQNDFRLGLEEDVLAILEKMVEDTPEDLDVRLSLALFQLHERNFEEAQKQLEILTENYPDSVAVAAARADLYINQNQPQKALETCEAFLATHNNLQAHIMRSKILLMTGKTTEVLDNLDVIETEYGNDSKALIFIGKLYQELKESEKVADVIEQLLSMDSQNDFIIQKELAFLLLSQHSKQHYNKGLEYLEAALTQNPNDFQLRLKKVQILINRKNALAYNEAKILLMRMVNEYPVLEQAWAARAQIALVENNLGQGMDFILQGLSYKPKSRLLLLMKARIESLRTPNLAINTYQLIYRQNPLDEKVLVEYSQAYRKAGEPQKALQFLQDSTARQASLQTVKVKQELMITLWETGQVAEAKQLYEQLIQETDDPSVLLSWLKLCGCGQAKPVDEIAVLYKKWTSYYPESTADVLMPVLDLILKTNQPEAVGVAKETVDFVLKQHPNSASACYSMAMLLHMAGQKEQAVQWYEKTIELDQQRIVAINNLAWILCTEKRQYKKALELADQGYEINPFYVDLIHTRGVIYMNLGEHDKAVEDLDCCSEMYFETNPRRTDAIFLLGKCLLQLDRKDQALLELLRARQQNFQVGGLTEAQTADLDELLKQLNYS